MGPIVRDTEWENLTLEENILLVEQKENQLLFAEENKRRKIIGEMRVRKRPFYKVKVMCIQKSEAPPWIIFFS